MNITKIPPSEFEVMKIIWNSDEAISSRDAIEALEIVKHYRPGHSLRLTLPKL